MSIYELQRILAATVVDDSEQAVKAVIDSWFTNEE